MPGLSDREILSESEKVGLTRCGFKDGAGLETAPDEKTPRADVPDRFHDLAVLVKEGRVDWVGHEAGVDGIAFRYEQPVAGCGRRTRDESACSLVEILAFVSDDILNLHTVFHKMVVYHNFCGEKEFDFFRIDTRTGNVLQFTYTQMGDSRFLG